MPVNNSRLYEYWNCHLITTIDNFGMTILFSHWKGGFLLRTGLLPHVRQELKLVLSMHSNVTVVAFFRTQKIK